MLKQRIITALILAPLAIAAIFYMSLENFSIFIMTVMAIGAWEWGPLMGFENKRRRIAFVITTTILIGAIWYYFPLTSLWSNQAQLQLAIQYILWIAVAWWVVSAALTFLYPRYSSFWASHRSIRGVFGWLTLVPTWLAFVVLRANEYGDDPYHGAQLIMFLFLMVWSADVGAYFVGKAIGKHKLMPNVSPGKTMEGFIGGVIFACALVALAGVNLGWDQQQFILVIGITAVITTISVLGDLNESMFKRQAGIKDSGSILPGHGGILDRIDSLTATAPIFALCYAYLGW
ncbi:MAG: phosphatidate cytidylyltransferase [Colwelliaceae bacterium]|nr:phosphatidate cytidylyltransferase [Colwelliaceae bacterium]